ncbi:hypothetical protein HDU76_006477, partial [Blyttiomyces sp. JEL0837]
DLVKIRAMFFDKVDKQSSRSPPIMNSKKPTSSRSSRSSSAAFELWNNLPIEIKDQIFNESDIPTRFINNRLLAESEIKDNAHDIWMLVIKTNWKGDISMLPEDAFPTILDILGQVKPISKDIYRRICDIRSNLTSTEYLEQVFDDPECWRGYDIEHSAYYQDMFLDHQQDTVAKLPIHIPMRYFWKNELEYLLNNLDKLKLFFVAGSGGHFQLFQHLYNEIFIKNHSTSIPTSEISLSKLFSYIIQLAAERGYINIIQFVLTKINIEDAESSNNSQSQSEPINLNDTPTNVTKPTLVKSTITEAIYGAIEHGHLDIIKILLKLPNDDPTFQSHNRTKFVSGVSRHLEVIKFVLLEVPGVDVLNISITTLYHAAASGSIDIVKFLLETVPGLPTYSKPPHPMKPLFNLQVAVEVAAQCGWFDVVKILLEVGENVDVSTALIKAAEAGNLSVVKYLVTVPGIDVSADDNLAIRSAATYMRFDVVRFLAVRDGVDVTVRDNEVLRTVTKSGNLETVKYLIGLPGVDPTADDNEAVRNAAIRGHEEVVKFLLTFPGVDLRSGDDAVFKWGASQGLIEPVRLWLLYSGVDASTISESFLSWAIIWGHFDIVKMLVEFPGVDVTFDDNNAVRNAATCGNVKLVENFMGIPGVDVTAMDNDAFTSAASFGHLGVVELLLTVPEVDVTVNDNEAFRMAASGGHVDVVELLLTVPGVNVSAEDYFALRMAAKLGNVEMLKVLLEVPGVDATVGGNEALLLAAERGHVEVVKLLMENVGESDEFVKMVVKAGAEEFVNMFGTFYRNLGDDAMMVRRESALKTLRTRFG